MNALADQILVVADWITLHLTLWLLFGVGVLLTLRTRFVQVRLFPHMLSVLATSRQGRRGGISSFQAFTITLAARVGLGNVFGVAAALLFGGPGAIFWMWIVALVGMATAFFEATLAQIFKIRVADATFRGGPAYYIYFGLKNSIMAKILAVITAFTCAIVVTSVQANGIAQAMAATTSAEPWLITAVLLVFSAPVIYGGLRAVARVSEWMAPIMALMYVAVVTVIVLINLTEFITVIGMIFTSAFAPEPLVGGLGGGILAAVINGTKRGVFSNEAGQATAPNAAATATVNHPVRQGLIQSLGVFVDTIIVCTATAFVILIAGEDVWGAEGVNPANLTTLAIVSEVGDWAALPMTLLVFVLAFSSILGAYAYAEVNVAFLSDRAWARRLLQTGTVIAVGVGAMMTLPLVWNTVDIAMALMSFTNLVALIFLAKWGVGALKDYEAQRKAGVEDPVFVGVNNPFLPADVPTDVWVPNESK